MSAPICLPSCPPLTQDQSHHSAIVAAQTAVYGQPLLQFKSQASLLAAIAGNPFPSGGITIPLTYLGKVLAACQCAVAMANSVLSPTLFHAAMGMTIM